MDYYQIRQYRQSFVFYSSNSTCVAYSTCVCVYVCIHMYILIFALFVSFAQHIFNLFNISGDQFSKCSMCLCIHIMFCFTLTLLICMCVNKHIYICRNVVAVSSHRVGIIVIRNSEKNYLILYVQYFITTVNLTLTL